MKIKEFYQLYYPNNIIFNNHLINKITDDSREVEENDVFVCVKGYNYDGHDYINEVIRKGVKTIIIDEKYNFYSSKINIIKSKNTLKDLSRLLFLFYDSFYSKRPKFIGVTGTNGKTTITTITYEYLKKINKDVLLVGTNGIKSFFGLKEDKFITNNTTPKLTTLFKYLMNVPVSYDYVIMEVSSQGISEGRVLGINYDVVLVNNLSSEHLDYHHSLEAYRDVKGSLISSVSQNKDAVVILNTNQEEFKFFNNLNNNKNIFYGPSDIKKIVHNNNDIIYEIKSQSIEETQFELYLDNKKYLCNTNLIGDFNIENLVASMAIIKSLNLLENNFFDFIKSIPYIDGRLNKIKYNSRYFIIDFAHNSKAVEQILKLLNQIKINNIITVIGCGGNRDLEKRPIMGNLAITYSDKVIFTEDNPRFENTLDIINDMLKDVVENNYEIIEDRELAIYKAYQLSKEEDFIVILGKGAESYIIKNGVKLPYSDLETVNKIITR